LLCAIVAKRCKPERLPVGLVNELTASQQGLRLVPGLLYVIALQPNVSQYILNIYEEEELAAEATHKKFLSVRTEGKRQGA
jgi:hypothetical protein